MAINETTTDYEILVRLNADGFVGAQAQTKTVYANGAEVLLEKLNEPSVLTLADLKTKVTTLTESE